MPTVLADGCHIDRYIPRDLRSMFYHNTIPDYKYRSADGRDPYSFIVDDSLVLYLPLWALKDSPIKSVDAYKHTCTVTDALWRPNGRLFAGAGHITVPDHTAFDIVTALTALQWVNCTNVGSVADETAISKYRTIGGKREWGMVKILSSGKVAIIFGDPSDGTFEGTRQTNNVVLSNTTWALVGFTYAAGTVVIYVDGAVVVSATVEGAIPITLYNGTSDVVIGANGASQSKWTGILGEGWVYSRALTAQEVQHNYLTTRWRYT